MRCEGHACVDVPEARPYKVVEVVGMVPSGCGRDESASVHYRGNVRQSFMGAVYGYNAMRMWTCRRQRLCKAVEISGVTCRWNVPAGYGVELIAMPMNHPGMNRR